MTLLIDRACVHCRNIEEAVKGISGINKFYVTDGMVAIDEQTFIQMDRKIPALPALITEKAVFCGEKYIIDFLTSQEKK